MIGMVIIWVSGSFCYYLISYQLKYIEGDLYLNSIVSSISEIIAYVISGLLCKRLGLKLSLRLSLLAAFFGMICLILFDNANRYIIAFFILGSKFGISAVYNIAYIGNTELFSLKILATSYGICNLVSRIATIFSPFIAEL